MGRATEELAGRRFGSLVAVRELRRERGGAVWLCRCDCGTTVEVPGPALRHGGRVSCGCARRKVRADLTGRRYGRWLVLGATAEAAVWWCRCACGTRRAVPHQLLQQRRTFSCGCSPRGRPLGSSDPALARRDRAILGDRRRGDSLRAIAARHGLTAERVRQILREARERPKPAAAHKNGRPQTGPATAALSPNQHHEHKVSRRTAGAKRKTVTIP